MKDDEPDHDSRSSSGWLVLYVLQNKISNHIYSGRRSRTMQNSFPLTLQVAWYWEDDCGSLGEALWWSAGCTFQQNLVYIPCSFDRP